MNEPETRFEGDVMPFGVHAGMTVQEIAEDYPSYARRLESTLSEIVQALRDALNSIAFARSSEHEITVYKLKK